MNVRISHCSTLLGNYELCLNDKVSGFINRGPQKDDLVYLVVKVNNKSICGARFILDEPSDHKPWPDADSYVNVMTIKNIEYCNPFDISILRNVGGKYWVLKYVQGAKPISDKMAIDALDQEFQKNKTNTRFIFDSNLDIQTAIQENDETSTIEDESELAKLIKEIPDVQVKIMGTFETIPFSNETDKIKGLERLVNENFYSLFPRFAESKTLLIPENRSFKTKGFKVDGNNVLGIRTIPDGLLIEFDKEQKNPFRINIIEYECYGEKKKNESDKSNYLNSSIIPQLMRFASAFSIITDEQTRRKTIDYWIEKIIFYITNEDVQLEKFKSWIKDTNPDIKEHSLMLEITKLLNDSFKSNLRVLLIIDELSREQKSTIKNVVSSFKLANGDSPVQFTAYVVRLVQKINIFNNESEYALTIQEQ